MEGRVGRVLRAAGYPQSTEWPVGTFWLPQPHVEKGQEEWLSQLIGDYLLGTKTDPGDGHHGSRGSRPE